MNLLHANDRQGVYPASFWAQSTEALAPFAPLRGAQRYDVCVVGAGFTGLSTALHLAEAGLSVVVLEAHRVGFGASGRNGGQLGSGQRLEQPKLEALVGRDKARQLWDLGEDAKQTVTRLIDRHKIDCHLRPGIAWAGTSEASVRDLHGYAAHMERHYGYRVEALDEAAFQALCPSPVYRGGVLDPGAFHLHPLALALGLARAATAAGAVLHENSEVTRIDEGKRLRVSCAQGEVEADHLVLACNGYLGGLNRHVAGRVMPLNNFIVATEPLGARASEVLARDIAVSDDYFVLNYFKLSHDGRLLFGGGESYGYRFPEDLFATVRKPLAKVFPQLGDVALTHAWGGTLGITRHRVPHLARLSERVLSASGYSGHGIGNAIQAGRLLAEAIRGDSAGFACFDSLPSPVFPGGTALRKPLLTLAMSWFALRDRLGL